MKLTIPQICTILITLLFQSCQTQRVPEVFLLPENHKGFFVVVYDQPNGQENIRSNNEILYRIPSSGVLFIKDKYKPGKVTYEDGTWYQHFFTVDSSNNRKPLARLDIGNFNNGSAQASIPEKYSRDSVGIFIIAAAIMGDEKTRFTTTKYFIGTFNELTNAKDNMPFEYIDSLRLMRN